MVSVGNGDFVIENAISSEIMVDRMLCVCVDNEEKKIKVQHP